MTTWEFRALVRAFRERLECSCPLGVGEWVVHGWGSSWHPNPVQAARGLKLEPGFALGVAAGWDDVHYSSSGWLYSSESYERGRRYGRRLREVTEEMKP